ncbi:MAG: hypothetical protein JWR72_2305 [Flavisolibacter sp.]|jgi:hypothetical protein|nr:hypothetical protein [Flavisolibacter sp.]
MPVIGKSRIIEAIQHTEDERILFAINRLLQIEQDEIPGWHKEVLDERLKSIEEGTAVFHNWNAIKDSLFKR